MSLTAIDTLRPATLRLPRLARLARLARVAMRWRLGGLLLVSLAVAPIGPWASADELSTARAQASPLAAAAARPNLLVIVTDDQDLLLGSLDAMPRVRELLGAQGATFNNFFVPLSLCCPARATLLTGRYPHHHGILTNRAPNGGFARFASTGESGSIAPAMAAAGYRTGFFGKYLNGYPQGRPSRYVPPGWHTWVAPLGGAGYDAYDYDLNEDGEIHHHGRAPEDYLTDVLAARAEAFIAAAAQDTRPFFALVAPFAPHKPFVPAPRHAELYAGARAPRGPSFNEADVRDKRGKVKGLRLLSAAEIAELDRAYRLRLQSLRAVDDLVAGLAAALAAHGELEHTYIFFTSDNGYHLGQHRLRAGKYTPYEEDVRVPLLVRGPGVAAGTAIGALAASVDLAPTWAELGGARLAATDGRSLVAWLHGGRPARWRRAVLLEQSRFQEVEPDEVARPDASAAGGVSDAFEPLDAAADAGQSNEQHIGLRAPGFKFVEYRNGAREYYDLDTDPAELESLADRLPRSYLDALAARARALAACRGEGCRQLESRPLPRRPS